MKQKTSSMLDGIKKNKPLAGFYNHTYISLKHKYAYFAVGKAANSTVKHHLFELEYSNTNFKIRALHDRRCSPLLSPFQFTAEQVEAFLSDSDVFKFTFVRNPYSRLLSCYLDRIVPKESAPYRQLMNMLGKEPGDDVSFDSFIRAICDQTPYQMNPHWRVQVNETLYDSIDYDFIGRVETFGQDMAKVWSEVSGGFDAGKLGELNKSPSVTRSASRLNDFYSPELTALVADKYAEDFDVFDYDKQLES